MTYSTRIRPTALVIANHSLLLVEYCSEKRGQHYFLPGGGVEPGETVKATLQREMVEETAAQVDVGPIAFLYECEPQYRADDYSPTSHTIFIIFECSLKEGSIPRMPAIPEQNQTGVKWIPIDQLNRIKLVPNIADQIIEYTRVKRNIELIEDHIL